MNTIAAAVSFAMRIRMVEAETGTKLNRVESARNWLGDAAAILSCQTASIWALQPDGETLKLLVGLMREEESLARFELAMGEGITGCAARAMQPLAVENVSLDDRHSRRADEILGHVTRQILSCPMARDGFIGGVVNFLNRRPEASPCFCEDEILAGQILAGALIDFCATAELVSARRINEPPPSTELAKAFAAPSDSVFASAAMRAVVARVRAHGDKPLLIQGEPGSGRRHLARMAHRFGAGSHGSFNEVDCRKTLADDWEAILFGAVRGAAAGLAHDRPGFLELAHGGTLFLNHIGSLPEPIQRKLAKFMESGGEFRRVGDARNRRSEIRLIAADSFGEADGDGATHATDDAGPSDLGTGDGSAAIGKSSGALGPPLSNLPWVWVRIPPLRERRDDIIPLASIALRRIAEREGRRVPWLTQEAAEALRYGWDYPGNVRELIGVMEEVYVRSREEEGGDSIMGRNLPSFFGSGAAASPCLPAGKAADPERPERGGDKVWVFSQLPKLLDALKATRCESSGRWNLSSAHRRLNQERPLGISRVAFAQRVRVLEPRLRALEKGDLEPAEE